jgi:hypothetical protein
VQIAPNVSVGTVNNRFSDDLHDFKTLIHPESPLHAAAVTLHKGQLVKFSGEFGPDSDDCFKENSLTVEGAMTVPEFLFRFTWINPSE